MTDIVEELRPYGYDNDGRLNCTHDVRWRAKEHIEALRREVAAINFWRECVYEGRTMTAEEVAAELTDYHMILENVSKVYCAVSGGKISKENTNADAVISEFENQCSQAYEEGASDREEELLEEIKAAEQRADALERRVKELQEIVVELEKQE